MSVESINNSAAVAPQPSVQRVDKTNETAKDSLSSSQVKSSNSNRNVEATVIEREELETAVTKLNDYMQTSPQRNLSFSVDESSKEVVVVVTDKLTDEVIKQMPTKEALAVAKQIESMLGLILNDKA
ncbi:MAG: flagellar protein FlaG [Oceanospirillaceae bacterium]